MSNRETDGAHLKGDLQVGADLKESAAELASLNEQAASKLGWTDISEDRAYYKWRDLRGYGADLPNYTGDIQAAWTLVESFYWFRIAGEDGIRWFAETSSPEKGRHVYTADTAPEAIVRAFLAVGEGDDWDRHSGNDKFRDTAHT